MRECTEFYFLWKKVCVDEWRRMRIVRRKRIHDSLYNLRSANDQPKPTASDASFGVQSSAADTRTVSSILWKSVIKFGSKTCDELAVYFSIHYQCFCVGEPAMPIWVAFCSLVIVNTVCWQLINNSWFTAQYISNTYVFRLHQLIWMGSYWLRIREWFETSWCAMTVQWIGRRFTKCINFH